MFQEDRDLTEVRSHCMGIGLPVGIAFSAIFVFAMKTPGLIGVGV